MTVRKRIKFGTSGWRGILADDFTFENVRIVAQAIATELLKEPKVKNGALIGYDTRFLTEEFAWTIAQVFAGNGIQTYVCREPTPTPVLSYTIRKKELAGGVNITASHNPFYWNGIKYNPENGGPALPEVTKRIEIEIENIAEGKSELHFLSHQDDGFSRYVNAIDPATDYKEYILSRIDVQCIRNVIKKVCVDLSYSTGIDYLDALLYSILQTDNEEALRLLNDYRDPYFGGDRPEPDKKRMKELGKNVIEQKAQVGLTVDGDADRFGIVDDHGDAVTANEYLAIVAWHLYKNKGLRGDCARSIATSHAIDRVARHYGYQTKVTPVGFKFIGEALLNEGIVLGGEESGGLSIQGHVPEKDGILACLLALEVIAFEEKPLSEIRKEVEKISGKFFNDRIDLELENEQKKIEIMDFFSQLNREVFGYPIKEKTSMDGIGFILDTKEKESWLLVRASGTEPVIRIYIESDDIAVYEKLVAGAGKIG